MEIGIASCRCGWIGWKADIDVAADAEAEADTDGDGIDHMLVT